MHPNKSPPRPVGSPRFLTHFKQQSMSEAIIERMKVLANIHITGTMPSNASNQKIAKELADMGFLYKKKGCRTRLTAVGFNALENHIKSKQTSV